MIGIDQYRAVLLLRRSRPIVESTADDGNGQAYRRRSMLPRPRPKVAANQSAIDAIVRKSNEFFGGRHCKFSMQQYPAAQPSDCNQCCSTFNGAITIFWPHRMCRHPVQALRSVGKKRQPQVGHVTQPCALAAAGIGEFSFSKYFSTLPVMPLPLQLGHSTSATVLASRRSQTWPVPRQRGQS
jgi:hypothetical protein